ncbi:bifunctional hydroxymethylpyrimidine kinase/phosphomethylpyrimidine kinase [Metabacillus arenae]|uniref:Hydroxymethylpyrimidine/phosphomethylpyrimidine kinase n=1 Tax=Metabacillus arenae TaxID=2771434 RepID=A0A926NCT7_9BACI|nr:bifunctional hydroxymethylpyrimidine kinase/phosphomethylpyrimidine kinase [Metabacillus arenae]MBD1381892.1 bifunctional hydroxymethylpyrimidine kinase/phosphomethylpyrimidine kinase [Metabacillus arenae]
MKYARALTIAGSDSGGGAGIQADLKTFQELGVFGMSALTAVTAQNTLGVHGVYPMSLEALENQIDAVAADLPPAAIKTGMLFNSDMIELVARKVKEYDWNQVVIDPVMVAKGGQSLLQEEAVEALIEQLLPLSYVITPNLPEAEALVGMSVQTIEDRKLAAKKLHQKGARHVVIKGGHGKEGDQVIDLLFDGENFTEFESQRIQTKHTHGTGCTYAAAITAEIAKGKSVKDAVNTAKQFIQAAIEHTLEFGEGHGPTNHWAYNEK